MSQKTKVPNFRRSLAKKRHRVKRISARLDSSRFGWSGYARENFSGITLCNFMPVFLAQPLDGLEYRYEVLEVASGLGIDGIYRAEHLRGEQNVVDADPFDQKLHRLL